MHRTTDPYMPPDAPVADMPRMPIGRLPWAVIVALLCLLLLMIDDAIWIAGVLSLRRYFESLAIVLLPASVLMVCTGFIAWCLARRIRWARWCLVAIAAFHVMEVASKIVVFVRRATQAGGDLPIALLAFWMLPALLAIAATLLVFWPAGRWFASPESARQ